MSASWEQISITTNEVLVVILTRETVSTVWALNLRNMILPKNSSIMPLSGMPFDHARNTGVQRALEGGYDNLFFLDDDVIIPPDTYQILKSRNKDIISGLYYRRADPMVPCMLKRIHGSSPTWITSYSENELKEVDFVGAGCLLIKRDVLEKVKKPWFNWLVDDDNNNPYGKISEDFYFCKKSQESGFKIFVDTSVQCRHVGYGQSAKDGFTMLKY